MTEVGIGVTAATVAVLVIAVFRARRRRPFPVMAGLASWRWRCGMADVSRRRALRDIFHADRVARMALISIPLWLIFEGYNLRLRNWIYTACPPDGRAHCWATDGRSRRSHRLFSKRLI
ncbi:MAG: hypothetical protein ACRD4C_14350 [Candidatus Acidiferrales bacterium]